MFFYKRLFFYAYDFFDLVFGRKGVCPDVSRAVT